MRDQQPERFTPYDVVRDDDECARLVAEGRLRATTTELA